MRALPVNLVPGIAQDLQLFPVRWRVRVPEPGADLVRRPLAASDFQPQLYLDHRHLLTSG